jgi:fused signal recognition particle receptor
MNQMIQSLFGSVEREPTLLEKLKSGVQKTRAGLVSALEDAIQGHKEIDADLLDELEFTLISADIGVRTTQEILDRIRQRVERHQLNDAAGLRGLIREHLLEILQASDRAPARVEEPPAVILAVGVNGSGKTTTLGKLSQRSATRAAPFCSAPRTRSAPPPSINWKSGASAPEPPSSARPPAATPAPCCLTLSTPPRRATWTT